MTARNPLVLVNGQLRELPAGDGLVTDYFTATGNAALGDAEASDTHAIKGATTLLANSASAALTVTQTGGGNAFVVEDSASTDSTPFVIDASGNIVIGGVTAATSITGTAKIQLHGAGEPASALSLQNYQASSSYYPTIEFAKSKNSTDGSHTVVASGDILGRFYFTGSDGAAFIRAAQIEAIVDGTPGTNDMPGRLVFSTTADGGSIPTERMRIDSSGNVGIGTTSAYMSLRVAKNVTGGTIAYGVVVSGQVQTDVTVGSYGFTSLPSFANYAAAQHKHFDAAQGTISGTLTDQKAFSADSSLTGATNNYGFFSNIAAATGRWNFYAAGTAQNYFAGATGIGSVPFSDASATLRVGTTTCIGTAYSSVYVDGTIPATATSSFNAFVSTATTAASSFTLGTYRHFYAAAITPGASSAITNQYGFVGALVSGSGKWNFYASGSANNAYAGNSSFGKVTAPTSGVDTTSFGTNLVTNIASTYTVLSTDGTIIQTTAASTYTLPTASSFPGRILKLVTQFAGTVVSASSNVVPIAGGAAGTAILAATAGKYAVLQSNGTNWVITEAN